MWNMQDLDTGWSGQDNYVYMGQTYSGTDLNYFGVGVGFAYNNIPPLIAGDITWAWHSAKHEGTSASSAENAMYTGYDMYYNAMLDAEGQNPNAQMAYSKVLPYDCPFNP